MVYFRVIKFILLIILYLNSHSSTPVQIVRIEQLDENELQLSQIEAINSSGINVAKENKITMSSTYDQQIANHCSDGKGNSVCQTITGRGSWIELNLGIIHNDIIKIKLISNRHSADGRNIPSRVYLKDGLGQIVDTFAIEQYDSFYNLETKFLKDLFLENYKIGASRINKIKYIKIQNEDPDLTPIDLAQVLAFSIDGINLALQKQVTRSSVEGDTIAVVTDGIAESSGKTYSLFLDEWIMVDLGQDIDNIEKIKLITRKDCCQSRMKYAHVYLLNSAMELVELFYTGEVSEYYEFYPSCQNLYMFPNEKVRFIRLQIDPISISIPLVINEIEAFDKDENNIAYGKKCSASSILDSFYSPSQIVDGNLQDYFHSSNSILNQWVEIDLEEDHFVEYIKIVNIQICCWERLVPSYIYLLSNERKLVNRGNITHSDSDYKFDFTKE